MSVKTRDLLTDIGVIAVSAVLTALAMHYFIISNNFAPGGVTGLATMAGYLLGINVGYFSVLFNLPILIWLFIAVKKRLSVMLLIYVALQSLTLIILDTVSFPAYVTENNIILASIGGGILSGCGFTMMIKRFGASGGTYAIAAIIRKKRPETNIVWVSFIMDSFVVALAFFVYGFKIEPVLATLINLFIANRMSDMFLQGFKMGYKYEIVTDTPHEISDEIIAQLNGSVTRMPAEGMYTRSDKSLLVCIIRKRHIGEMNRILKKYPNTFVCVSKISEVTGGKF